MVKEYVPDKGDLVWLDFNPQTGHEQAGHRPALILSPRAYNRIGLAIMCPVTTKSKRYPFEVELKGVKIKGFVLADQVKSLDWQDRGARYIGRVPTEVLVQVLQRINILLGLKSSYGFEEKSRIRSEMEECGFFVFKKGKEGTGLGCRNPELCRKKRTLGKEGKRKTFQSVNRFFKISSRSWKTEAHCPCPNMREDAGISGCFPVET
jgi:mRNA interferase MazF